MLETFITNSGTGVSVLHTDEEVETRDTQVLDSGNDVEFEPYETPIPLQRREKKKVPAPVSESEVEVLEVEESQQRKASFKGKRKGSGDKETAWVLFVLIDRSWLITRTTFSKFRDRRPAKYLQSVQVVILPDP